MQKSYGKMADPKLQAALEKVKNILDRLDDNTSYSQLYGSCSDDQMEALLDLAGEDNKAELKALEKSANRWQAFHELCSFVMVCGFIAAMVGLLIMYGGTILGAPILFAGAVVYAVVFTPIELALGKKTKDMHDKVIAKFKDICETARDYSKTMRKLGQTAAPEASPDASPSPGSIARGMTPEDQQHKGPEHGV